MRNIILKRAVGLREAMILLQKGGGTQPLPRMSLGEIFRLWTIGYYGDWFFSPQQINGNMANSTQQKKTIIDQEFFQLQIYIRRVFILKTQPTLQISQSDKKMAVAIWNST